MAAIVVVLGACAQADPAGQSQHGASTTDAGINIMDTPGDAVIDQRADPTRKGGRSDRRTAPRADVTPELVYAVEMTVPDGMIPGFPGGTSSRQELLSRSGTSERISLVRTGTYWGTERRQEDVLTRTRDGWTLIERIDHYRSQSDGTWKQDRCSAESEGPFIAIRRPVGDRWAVTLRCTATHIIQQFEFEVIDTTTKTFAGKQHDVLVVRSSMTQSYDPPQPFRSGTVARTEWISASLEIPIEWTKESRGGAGEQGPSDRARLMPPG